MAGDTNGRALAWVLGVSALLAVVVGWGIAWGTVATRQIDHSRRITKVEATMETVHKIAVDVVWIKEKLENNGTQ